MAYTKILVIHNRLDKCVDYALNEEKTSLSSAIDYALNRDKTEQTCFETAINCDLTAAYADMLNTKRRWGRDGGNYVWGYHIIQSFVPGEVTPEEAHAVGVTFAERLLGDRYEVIVATHLNKAHLHNHVVLNSVSFMDGKMYRNNFRDYFGGDGVGIRGTSDAICQEHSLSVIDPGETVKDGFENRAVWNARQTGKPTIRDTVRRDIDAAIAGAFTMQTFWEELRRRGYTVKRGPNVMHTTVCPPGGKRNIRLDGLGQGYTEEAIKDRIAAVRNGEAPPEAPSSTAPPQTAPSPFLTPGRHYRPRGRLHAPRKLHGFRALYFKYLYLLGKIRRGTPPPRVAFSLRKELIQFERYQQQFRYLTANRIETAAQLTMQQDALQAAIDALTDHRRDLYRARRADPDDETIRAEIEGVTAALRPLRRELNLCARIEGDIPKIQEGVRRFPTPKDRSKTHEKANQGRPCRHSPAGADLPPNAR